MASSREVVLIVDDNLAVAESHAELAHSCGYLGLVETDPFKVLDRLKSDKSIRTVLLDIKMPQMNGLELLSLIRSHHPSVGVIMATVLNDISLAVEAIKNGAYNYLLKPVQEERLGRVLKSLTSHRPRSYKGDPRYSQFVTADPQFESIFDRLTSFASKEVPVLIMGETGTGKEILANLVHVLSHNSNGPLIPVNIASVSPTLFESQFFGHVRGAFTGAVTSRDGYIEAADGGTLFLDEIGELSEEHQAKLLRVLQDGDFQKVGSTTTQQSSARFVFATNRDLKKEVENGRFREDLYYRLASHTVTVPPLRSRPGDIQVLARYFLQKYSTQYGRYIEGLSEQALMYLESYPFPGNVRELEGMMSAAALLEEGMYVQPSSLPPEVTSHRGGEVSSKSGPVEFHSSDLKGMRKQAIYTILRECDGNQTQAAKRLGIARGSLSRILKRFRDEEIEVL